MRSWPGHRDHASRIRRHAPTCRASSRRARGEHEAALGYLREVEGALLRQELRSPSLGAAIRARMQLHLWRARPADTRLIAEVRRRATACGLDADGAFAHPEEPSYAALAPVLLALGEHEAALALARRLCQVAEHAGRFGDLLGYQVTYALALDALGRRDAAIAAIRRAPATPYRDGILRAFGDATPPATSVAAPPLVEPLSARARCCGSWRAGGPTRTSPAS